MYLYPFQQNGGGDESERDVYEYMLTQSEIQAKVIGTNVAVDKEIAEAKCKLTPLTLDWLVYPTCSLLSSASGCISGEPGSGVWRAFIPITSLTVWACQPDQCGSKESKVVHGHSFQIQEGQGRGGDRVWGGEWWEAGCSNSWTLMGNRRETCVK